MKAKTRPVRDSRRSAWVRSPIDALESRRLMSADFHAVGPIQVQTVVTGLPTSILASSFYTSPAGHVDAATIDWGDGSAPSAGTITPEGPIDDLLFGGPGQIIPSPGSYGTVTGGHSYAHPGSYTVTATLIEHQDGQADQTDQATAHVSAEVPSLSASASSDLTEAAGIAFGGGPFDGANLATGSTNLPIGSSGLKATVDWGDGSAPSSATILPNFVTFQDRAPGLFNTGFLFAPGHQGQYEFRVTGAHTYAHTGIYSATVTIDGGTSGLSATTTTAVNVVPGTLHVRGVEDAATAGYAKVLEVAHVDDFTTTTTGTIGDPSAYAVTIDWGDGTAPSAGRLALPIYQNDLVLDHGTFRVQGDHTYAQTGSYTVTVTVSGKTGGSVTTTSTVTVSPLTVTLAPGPDFTTVANSMTDVYGHVVATGTINADVPFHSLKATIDWGDGTAPEAGVLYADPFRSALGNLGIIGPGNPFAFAVSGSHNYALTGTYTVHVTVTSPDGSAVSTDAKVTAVEFHAYGLPIAGVSGQALGGDGVAAIGIPGADADPSRYSATIDWGDGSAKEAGVLFARASTSPPWFAPNDPPHHLQAVVAGSHIYAHSGIFAVSVTIRDGVTGQIMTVQSSAFVSPAGPIGDDSSPPGNGSLQVSPPLPPGLQVPVDTSPGSATTTAPVASHDPIVPPSGPLPLVTGHAPHRKGHHAPARHPVTHPALKAVATRSAHPHGPKTA